MPQGSNIAPLIGGLVDPARRHETIAMISQKLGIDTFLIFLPDPENRTLLAAPGFPQTLAGGRHWRKFLAQCAEKGEAHGKMPWPDPCHLVPTRAIAASDGSVIALVGGAPDRGAVDEILLLFPLVSAALKGEGHKATHAAQARFAADLVKQSATLARRLDEARMATQKELTARTAAEHLARTREQQLRAIVETTPEWVTLVAQDGTLLEMNPAGLRLVQAQSREQVVGSSIYDLIAPEFRVQFQKMTQAVCQGAHETLQFQLVGLSGTRRWMEAQAVPVIDPATGQTVQLALGRDITARKRDEALLAGEREVLELLLRGRSLTEVLTALALTAETQIPGSLASILLLDRAEGRLLHGVAPSLPESFNRAHHGLRIGPDVGGCAVTAYTGKRVLVHDVRTDRSWAAFRSLTAPIGLRGSWSEPIVSTTGEVIGTFGFYVREARLPTDNEIRVLERLARFAAIPIERQRADDALQKARQELEHYAEELERRVADRTAKLSETVGELEAFSYSVAHDMRAPLRAMQGYAAFVIEDYGGKLDPEAVKALKKISTSAIRLDRLIQDVLNYSKIVRGDFDLYPVDVDQLVREVIDSFHDWHPPKAEVLIEGKLPVVIGNDAFLTQCVTNLVGNGLKFVEPGKRPRVVISARNGDGDGQTQIRFQDSGIGIDEKDQERIFRIFERVNPLTEFEGTGIGLAIVRKAAERMGGAVGLESAPGRGSVFSIKLKKAQL